MTTRIACIGAVAGAALALAVPALGDSWGADLNQAPVHVSPDLADRMAAARQQEVVAEFDARKRASSAGRTASTRLGPEPVRDDHYRLDPTTLPTPIAATEPGGGIDWAQLGIGFFAGVLLMAALIGAMRIPRVRQPAH